MATLKDVSKLAKVSATTVSIIVNGKTKERHISEETVQRVNAAIRELNYQPSISARALRNPGANKFVVGLYWVNDFRSSFLARFLTGIQAAKLKMQRDINLVICPYKPDELYKETDLFQTDRFNAVIIATASQADMKYLNENPVPVPTILNNRDSSIYHTVKIDNQELGHKAAKHLLERKVKTVGIVSLKAQNHAMNNSTKGFMDACAKMHMEVKPEFIIEAGMYMEDGYNVGKIFAKAENLPDAIFCDNDSTAIGLIAYFNKIGIRVPEDIQVIAVGIGNSNYTRFYNPSITIVNIPLEQLAEAAMMIIEKIADNRINEPQHLLFDSNLLQRESTKML